MKFRTFFLRLFANRLIPLILALSFALAVALPTYAEQPPDSINNQKFPSFKRLEEGVQKFSLSNGLRVVFYKRAEAPIFSGQVWAKVGGVDEVPGKTGLAHLLEHMAFKGSKTIGTKDYEKEKVLLTKLEALMSKSTPESLAEDKDQLAQLEEQLGKLSVDNEFSKIYLQKGAAGLNAMTSKDYTAYVVSLPNTAFELWCWMESDRLLNPVFRQFYKEREVVQEERRSNYDDSPEGKLYEALLSTAFWMHPNRLPVIGWPSDVKKLQISDIDRLYHTYYRPDNMVLSLVGDLDIEKIKPLLERYFARLPAVTSPLPTVDVLEEEQHGERESVVEFDAEPSFAIAFHKPTYPDPDDARFAVLHSLLSGGRSAIFYKELVLKKQFALSVDTSEAPGELYPNIFYVDASPRVGVTSEFLRDQIQLILDRLKTELVSQKDLEAAKRRVQVELLDSLDSNSGLATIFGKSEALWGDWSLMFDFYQKVLATTPEDIQQLARKYFEVSNRTYVYLARPKKH